jgi:hypothetical protein
MLGFARLAPSDTNPWMHVGAVTRILTYVFKAVDDEEIANEIVDCLQPGINTYQGASNAGDSIGYIGYPIIWGFSQVRFLDPASACDYVPGDINGNDDVNSSDVTYGVNYLRGQGSNPPDSCFDGSEDDWLYAAADANGNCSFTSSDITYLVNYLRQQNDGPLWCERVPPVLGLDINAGKAVETKAGAIK